MVDFSLRDVDAGEKAPRIRSLRIETELNFKVGKRVQRQAHQLIVIAERARSARSAWLAVWFMIAAASR